MDNLGANDNGKRNFLISQNAHLNQTVFRPKKIFSNKEDLIFMQIDADCDMLTNSYGNLY